MHGDYADAIAMGLGLVAISIVAAIFLVWYVVAWLWFARPTWLHIAGWSSILWWLAILGFIAWRWVMSP